MSSAPEHDFPAIFPPDPGTGWPTPPWEKKHHAYAWLEDNWEMFFFSPEHIIENFQRYEHHGSAPHESGIYFLGLEADIGYVGKATSIARRIWAHRKARGKEFSHFWCITGIPQDVVLWVEAFYIRWLNPPLNGPTRIHHEFLSQKADELRESHPWPPADWAET